MAADYVVGQTPTLGRGELLAAGSLKDGTALLDDVRHILCAEIDYLVGDKTAITAIYTFDFQPIENCRTCDRTDCGIHARGIAAGSQNAYGLNLCHMYD